MPQTSNKAASLLRWYVRLTRFGTTHLVRLQENDNSCAPSCAMMVHTRMNKLTTVTDGMATEQSMVKNVRKHVSGKSSWNPDTQWTNAADMEQLLNSFNIGQWEGVDVGANGVTAAAVESASFFNLSTVPIMVHVDWGHWVMIDYMFKNPISNSYWAVVCDPWDGHVHVTEMKVGQAVAYNNRTPILSWSFPPVWSYRKGGSTGHLSGYIVRCTGMDVTSRLGKILLGTGI